MGGDGIKVVKTDGTEGTASIVNTTMGPNAIGGLGIFVEVLGGSHPSLVHHRHPILVRRRPADHRTGLPVEYDDLSASHTPAGGSPSDLVTHRL